MPARTVEDEDRMGTGSNTAAMNAHLAEIARNVAPFVGEMIPRIMS